MTLVNIVDKPILSVLLQREGCCKHCLILFLLRGTPFYGNTIVFRPETVKTLTNILRLQKPRGAETALTLQHQVRENIKKYFLMSSFLFSIAEVKSTIIYE